MTLTEFLLARITEDEATAHACPTVVDISGWPDTASDYLAAWDPGRVLDECVAKRKIIEWCSADVANSWEVGPVLVLLTMPYMEHPDFDLAWLDAA